LDDTPLINKFFWVSFFSRFQSSDLKFMLLLLQQNSKSLFRLHCLQSRTLFTTAICLDHRIKTSKERKEHFMNVNSWKAHDLNETRHVDLEANEEKRLPKKKVALMLGYNGSEYQGMQA
jgi:hypothetical protein